MATGKTAAKFAKMTYNAQVVTANISSLTAVGLNYPEIDITVFSSTVQERLLGIPEVKITVSGPLDNTATTGALAVFTAAATLGSQTGAAVLIDYGIRAAATTGDPRFSNTLMSVSVFAIDTANPNDAPKWSATLVTMPGSAASFTTVP